MNKNILSILGCSGSLALALLNTNSATAQPTDPNTKEYVFKAPVAERVQIERNSQQQPTSPYLSEDVSDREGDLAISLYGCDCNGCRNLVGSLERSAGSIR